MKPARPRVLTINGGLSRSKFALFETGESLLRIPDRGMQRIGAPEATLRVKKRESGGQRFAPLVGPGSQGGGAPHNPR